MGLIHPYSCFLCGDNLIELPLGFLECVACKSQFLPTYDRDTNRPMIICTKDTRNEED